MAMDGRGEVVMENGRGGDAAEKVEPVGVPCGYYDRYGPIGRRMPLVGEVARILMRGMGRWWGGPGRRSRSGMGSRPFFLVELSILFRSRNGKKFPRLG
jgi:hypothetical protein